MEAYNLPYPGTQWIHHTPDTQQVQDAAVTSPATDDWSKERPHSAMDLSDHSFGLGDMQASTSSAASMTPAQSFYQSYSPPLPQNGFFAPFNAMPYGQAPWTQPPLPLSSYSTLNGATSSASQPQQQQSPPMQSMMIDPALTINGNSPNGSHSYSQPSSSNQHQHSPFQNQHTQQSRSPPLSINPMYVNPSSQQLQLQQQLQQQQQQRTLSPSALHSPVPNSIMNSLMSPMFYSMAHAAQSHAPAPVMSAQDRKQLFQDGIRQLLAPSALSGAGAVRAIVAQLNTYGAQDVDSAMRLEIVTKIRDNAGNHFFRAWAENFDAMDIFREWLKAGATGKDDGQWEDTIMPLLHVIDRLPLTIEGLKASKLGKIIMKLMKEPPTSAIKDMASNIERKWRQMIASASDSAKKAEGSSTEDKTKKRKSSDVQTKAAPPAKKLAMGTLSTSPSASRASVKKETKVVVTAVKDVKSDSSFFSAPKPKPKLPSFKKAPPLVVKQEANIAQPNAFDPFQEALKSMAKNRTASPVVSTPPPTSAGSSAPASINITKSAKKKKSVTWASESQLEQIRLIDKAVYDDDPVDGTHETHNIRDLERGEGAALHAHLFEEAIDWYEPQIITIPPDIEVRPRGIDSQEKDVQEEREKSSLGALYMSAAQIPDSPAEPSHQIPVDEVDVNVKPMLAGDDIQPFFSNMTSVADLVGQLKSSTDTNGGLDGMVLDPSPAQAQGMVDLRGLGLDAGALSALTQQLVMGGMLGQQAAFGTDPTWNYLQQQQQQQQQEQQQYAEYGYDDESASRGGRRDHGWASRGDRSDRSDRGRGRGRGEGGFSRKRKPCSFYAAGRCKFGDSCDFSHDAAY